VGEIRLGEVCRSALEQWSTLSGVGTEGGPLMGMFRVARAGTPGELSSRGPIYAVTFSVEQSIRKLGTHDTPPESGKSPLFRIKTTMPSRFATRATSLLLSAILLAAGFVPPGVRHHHEVSDGQLAGHDHGESDATADHHDHECTGDVVGLKGGLWHLHFEFLGLGVTLPDGRHLGSDEQEVAEFQFVPASEDVPVRAASSEALLLRLLCSSSGVAVDAAPLPSPPMPAPPVTSPPLCDRARFERSGVLLT
jgi:hypothetical protein